MRPPCGHIPTRSRRTALCCLRDAHPASSLIGRPSFIRIRDCWAGERMPLNSSTAPNVRGETLRAAPPTLRAPGRRWHPPHSRHSRSASPGGTLGREHTLRVHNECQACVRVHTAFFRKRPLLLEHGLSNSVGSTHYRPHLDLRECTLNLPSGTVSGTTL